MNVNADVTVGIPFYKGSNIAHLRIAIDSILSQTLIPKEIHLIQDGAVPKKLEETVNAYTANYPQVKHLLISQNMGLAHALNISILNSSSKYYARMDSDDITDPDRLSKQIDFLESNLDIDILGTWAFVFEDEFPSENCSIRIMPVRNKEIHELFHYQNPLIHPSVMFRRSVFAKTGLYNIEFRSECDLELWARALKLGVGISNLSEPLLYYRNTGVIARRSAALGQQIKARYRYNTLSPKLNILKVMSLVFRVLPHKMQVWGYKKLKKQSSPQKHDHELLVESKIKY
ncbi:glycosyltransferase [Nostoc sp. XA010]|uniref:glycosyltransferase n=1 Tax=Nostoc sp. XA010 TaxID=2780407 RepID=UPI001E4706E5|nr:glycosyltransferase [Nostoc sp. XA010]MCC5656501.1 glycosyltransferase [Nostoc sp. XA010]